MADYKTWLSKLGEWLQDVKEHEIKDWVNRVLQAEQEAKELGEEKYAQYKEYLKRDLAHFMENKDSYDDVAWLELKELLWYELAHMEDKSQLEWQALVQDFKHNGIYHEGEWIAMGTLVCKNCGHSRDIFHATQITACPECDGIQFTRKALQP